MLFFAIVIFWMLPQVFYSMVPTPDMEEWQQLLVSVTDSAELQNLEQHAEYGIRVAARTPQVGAGSLDTGRILKLLIFLEIRRLDVLLSIIANKSIAMGESLVVYLRGE